MKERGSGWAERLRRGSVEPVIGEGINFCGLKRLNTRGLSGARKKFIMCAATQNLKKLIKYSTCNFERAMSAAVEAIDKFELKINRFLFASTNYSANLYGI